MDWSQFAVGAIGLVILLAFVVFAMRQGEKIKPNDDNTTGGGLGGPSVGGS